MARPVTTAKSAKILQDAVRLMNDGKYTRAFARLKELLSKDPSHQEARKLFASLLLKFGNVVTAKGAFEALVKEAITRQDYLDAETLLREFLAARPRCVSFLATLGDVYELRRDPYAAVFEYEKAIEALLVEPDPDRPRYAQELFERVQQLAPSSFVANRVAARLASASHSVVTPGDGRDGAVPVVEETGEVSETEGTPVDLDTSAATEAGRHDESGEPVDGQETSVDDVPGSGTDSVASSDAGRDAPPDLIAAAPSEEVSLATAPEALRDDAADPSWNEARVGLEPGDLSATEAESAPVIQSAIPQGTPHGHDPDHGHDDEFVPFPPVDQQMTSAAIETVPAEQAPEAEPPPVSAVDEELSGDASEGSEPEEREEPEEPEEPEEDAREGPSWTVEEGASEATDESGVPRDAPGRPEEQDASSPEAWEEDPIEAESMSAPLRVWESGLGESDDADETALVAFVESSTADPSSDRGSEEAAPVELRMTEQRPAAGDGVGSSASSPWLTTSRPRLVLRPGYEYGRTFRVWLGVQVAILLRRVRWLTNSATRLTMTLCGAGLGVLLLTLGATVTGWLLLEQRPSEPFERLSTIALPKNLHDPKDNGYVLLLGFGVEASLDPVQAGYARSLNGRYGADDECLALTAAGGPVVRVPPQMQTPAEWIASADPVAQLAGDGNALSAMGGQHRVLVTRYKQWLELPFEDWGYGRPGGPDCGLIIGTHRLYLADGFAQSMKLGLERLETDLTAWRNVLAHATNSSTKVLAIEGITDDVAIMAGLLSRPSIEMSLLQRLMRLGAPLKEDERSLRWPLRHEFALLVQRMDDRLRVRREPYSLLSRLVAGLPVPKQRTLNAYAAYYDEMIKTVWTPTTTMPTLYQFARVPAHSWRDYLANPIDNMIGAEPVLNWDLLTGIILETDARLRLTGLLARLRTMPGSNIMAQVAQAGHTFYDPFTDLPMLFHSGRRTLYSVGMDRRDDGGDPEADIGLPLMAP